MKDNVELLVEDGDAAVKIAKEIVKFVERFACKRRQFVILIGQYIGDRSAGSCNEFCLSETTIKKEPSDLAHHGCSMIDRALPGPVQRLDILLFNCLLGNERNMRLARRRANRFCIIAVILLPAHKWLYILRTNDFDRVAKFFEFSRPVKSSGTSLDNDGPSFDLRYDAQ